MRVKFNPLAHDNLLNSNYVINDFPYKLTANTIVELGMGKGLMLSKLAKKNPNQNFIGIEKNETVAHHAMKLFDELKLDNIKIIAKDIKDLPLLITGKVKELHITFADPWPKKRHEKRRLTSKYFINLYREILADDGVIKYKTDNDKFYEYTLESFFENRLKISFATTDLHTSEKNKDNEKTSYEQKWAAKGKSINYIEAKF